MYKIGITGGIGSGKSTVAELFKILGVSVYSSDQRAKFLMVSNPLVRTQIQNAFGEKAYMGKELNKVYIASKVFSNSKELKKLNAIVHPAVKIDFDLWCLSQKSAYVLKEAAILFESKANIGLDKVILVTAPKALRISRVVDRDQSSEKEVLGRMDKQWSDLKKRTLSDFEIVNNEKKSVLAQVLVIHKAIVDLH